MYLLLFLVKLMVWYIHVYFWTYFFCEFYIYHISGNTCDKNVFKLSNYSFYDGVLGYIKFM